MIDRVSPLGFYEIQSPEQIAGGAGSGVFNIETTQAQGRIAFIMDAIASAVSGATLVAFLQTSSDNSTWNNVANVTPGAVGAFTEVTNVANTGGLQAIFVDSSYLNSYNRINFTSTGTNANFTAFAAAVYVQKNA
jgi:hypothetical protein